MGSLLKAVTNKSKEMNQIKDFDTLSFDEAQKYGTLKTLKINLIYEDPDNREIYDEYETDELAESMRVNGFRGAILAYPLEDHFVIESGHRTLEAAKKVPLEEIPVIITEPPINDIDRRKRLVLHNLHGRVYTPLRIAREAQYLFDTYSMEQEEMKQKGERPTEKLLDLVAKDLEISTSQVTKYRSLLKLIPQLQELANSGDYSWVTLAKASALAEELQKQLYNRILGETRILGPAGVTTKWIENEIEEYKYIKTPASDSSYNRNDTAHYSDELIERLQTTVKKRNRKADGAIAIRKSSEKLKSAFSEDAVIKSRAVPEVLQTLNEMRDLIDEQIKKLSS